MATSSPPRKTEESPPAEPESGASSLSLEKDVAIGLVGEHAREIDPEIEKRVLRKIDWFLIPAMIVGALCPHTSVVQPCSTILSLSNFLVSCQ